MDTSVCLCGGCCLPVQGEVWRRAGVRVLEGKPFAKGGQGTLWREAGGRHIAKVLKQEYSPGGVRI